MPSNVRRSSKLWRIVESISIGYGRRHINQMLILWTCSATSRLTLPLRTRRERADQLRKQRPEFFSKYAPEARLILEDLLEKYADHGAAQFVIPDILKLPPISDHGNIIEIAALFGGPDQLRSAVNELQSLLYAS